MLEGNSYHSELTNEFFLILGEVCMSELVQIDRHLKKVNLERLMNVVKDGDAALRRGDLNKALISYWDVFIKTCGIQMIEKIMSVYKKGNPRFKKFIEKRLFAALRHISSRMQDPFERYVILNHFYQLMEDNNIASLAEIINKKQEKIIKKLGITTERTPAPMVNKFWDNPGALIPKDAQSSIASSYGSKK